MSKLKLMGRFSALESDVPESTVSAAEDIPQDVLETAVDTEVDGTDTVEGHAVETQEAESEVENTDDDIEDLQETSEALESYLDIIQDARMSRRGLTKGEAHILYVGIDNSVRRVGLEVGDIAGSVSVESFDGGRDSLGRCASLENAIWDALKQFWEKIKEQVNKLVKYVRDWYLKHLDGTARLKKKAEKLKEKASNTNGTAKEKKVNVSVHRQLCGAGKAAPTSGDIVTGLKDLGNMVKDLSTKLVSSGLDTLLDTFEKTADEAMDKTDAYLDTGTIETSIGTLKSTLNKAFTASSGNASAASTLKATLGLTSGVVHASDILPGMKVAYYVEPELVASSTQKPSGVPAKAAADDHLKFIEKLKETAEKSKISFRYTTKSIPEIDSSKEYKTLETGEAGEICGAVVSMCEDILSHKQSYSKYESATKKFLSKMDTIYKKTPKVDADATHADIQRHNMKVARIVGGAGAALIRSTSASITNISSYGTQVGRAALVYVQASLSQYKD